MADEITIEERAAQSVVEVAAVARFWQIPKALAHGFGIARAHIEQSGADVEDMPYARYLDIDWDEATSKGAFGQLMEFAFGKMKMRMGMFSSQPLESAGDAIGTEIAAGRYVTTIHRGAYHEVGKAYRRIVEWAKESGVKLADNSIEHYIDDPTDMQTQDVRTRIWIAVEE